jgi:hypothetical protein
MWPFSRLKYTQSGRWFGTCFIFTYIGNFIIPTDELIFFRGVVQPPTRYESPIFVGYPTFWLTNVDNTYLLFWTIERNGIIIVIYIYYIPFFPTIHCYIHCLMVQYPPNLLPQVEWRFWMSTSVFRMVTPQPRPFPSNSGGYPTSVGGPRTEGCPGSVSLSCEVMLHSQPLKY